MRKISYFLKLIYRISYFVNIPTGKVQKNDERNTELYLPPHVVIKSILSLQEVMKFANFAVGRIIYYNWQILLVLVGQIMFPFIKTKSCLRKKAIMIWSRTMLRIKIGGNLLMLTERHIWRRTNGKANRFLIFQKPAGIKLKSK